MILKRKKARCSDYPRFLGGRGGWRYLLALGVFEPGATSRDGPVRWISTTAGAGEEAPPVGFSDFWEKKDPAVARGECFASNQMLKISGG